MSNELINIELVSALISAIVGAIAGGLVSLILEMRRERQKAKKKKEKKKEKIYQNRPELEIVKYKDYLEQPGLEINKKCDINIFLTKIESVSTENGIVKLHYKEEFFNKEEWCCVIYTFKNMGKTDILCVSPICVNKRSTILCDITNVQSILEYSYLSYSTLFDKKVRVGESFTMKVCYHKECIMGGLFSAGMIMGIEDCNKNFWEQPLFVPDNKIYEAQKISYEEYRAYYSSENAIECFQKPWLW